MRQYLLTDSELKIIQMLRQIKGDVNQHKRSQAMTITVNHDGRLQISTAKTREINTSLFTNN